MRNLRHDDPHELLKQVAELDNIAGLPAYDLEHREDRQVRIRVNEQVGPAMFKADPLIPGGYIANSLTIRAMRSDIFVLGNSLDELAQEIACRCGEKFDLQFWKMCPYCAHAVEDQA